MPPIYAHRVGPAVSFCFLDRLRHHAETDKEANLLQALERAYQDTHKAPLTNDVAEWLAEQLPKPPSSPSSDNKVDTSKRMGSDLMQWLGKRPPDQLCYLLSGFDATKSATLYFDTDYRIVQDMAQVYLEDRWHRLQSSFEGSMYGFGGGYKEDKGGGPSGDSDNTVTYDLTNPATRGKALKALRALNWTA